MPDVQRAQESWAVVVPVKRLAGAKTRLGLPAAERARLALAMAEDTIRACAAADAVRRVVVVTDDPDGAAMALGTGAVVVPDEPDAGLNPALRHGAAHAVAALGEVGIVTVSSDLPALRAVDLEAVLRAAAPYEQAIVADAAGTGTVLYAATRAAGFRPAYGGQSRLAHVHAGAADLTERASAQLRHDVDTVTDLRAAWDLGVGAATRRAVEAMGGVDRLR